MADLRERLHEAAGPPPGPVDVDRLVRRARVERAATVGLGALTAIGVAAVAAWALTGPIRQEPPIIDEPTPVEQPSPTATGEAAAVPAQAPAARFDATLHATGEGRLLLVGGLRSLTTQGNQEPDLTFDVWLYDPASGSWVATATPGDTPMFAHAAAFDPVEQTLVWFSGNRMDLGCCVGKPDAGTYEYDATTGTWTRVSVTGERPPARPHAEAVYDASAQRIVMFGGNITEPTTWSYDTAADTWTAIDDGPQPPARSSHAMAYDPMTARTYLYGGNQLVLDPRDEAARAVWAFDHAAGTWTEFDPAPGPPPMLVADLVADPTNQRLLLIGGQIDDPSSAIASYSDRMWAYDPATNTWTDLDQLPMGTIGEAAITLDADTSTVWLFGGHNQDGPSDQLWSLDLTDMTWTQH